METTNDKKNYSTIMFTRPEHKDELFQLLNDPDVQELMPESIRGKAGKMILWLARYIKGLVEFGIIGNKIDDLKFGGDVGIFYFRMKRYYDEWKRDVSLFEEFIKGYAENHSLTDESHPCEFDTDFCDGKTLLKFELSCDEFECGELGGFVDGLDHGGGYAIMTTIKDNQIHLCWDVSHNLAYLDALKKWKQLNQFEEKAIILDPTKEQVSKLVRTLSSQVGINGKEDEVLRLYYDGVSITEISRTLCIGYNTVTRFLKRMGIKRHSSKCRKILTDSEKTGIVKDYKNGLTLKQIMDKYLFRDHHVIYNILNEKGIKYNRSLSRRPGHIFDDNERNEIAKAYQDGMTKTEIMKKYGFSDHHVIYKILKERGIPTKMELKSGQYKIGLSQK